MVRVTLAIVAGLILAVFVAAAAGAFAGLPLLESKAGFEPLFFRLAKAAWPMLLWSLPFAVAAIAAAEFGRWRSWLYWGWAGAVIGLCGFLAFRSFGSQVAPAITLGRAPVTFAVMGLLGGITYWRVAGRNAGTLSAWAQSYFNPVQVTEKIDSRRCALCAALGLLLGLIPLTLLGWHLFYRSNPPAVAVISSKAQSDADRMLKEAGLGALKFSIDARPHHEHIGHVSGSVADYAERTKAFDKAKSVLAPLIGWPGVVAVLQNDILARDEADPQVAAENARIRAAQDAARSLAEEAAAIKKAEQARLAAEAEEKRKADEEAAAKKKAEDEVRLAAEAEEKRKADEEAAAKKKAEDEARLAAEAESKRKADEEAAVKKKAEDEVRRAAEVEAKGKADEEAAAKKKAEDEARRAAEVEAKGKAAEDAAQKPLPEQSGDKDRAWVPGNGMDAATMTRANCVSEFGQLFASEPVRFALKSASLESHHASFLDKLSDIAKKCDGIGLLIEGNSDAWGTEEFNRQLSEQRAEAVRAALVERGVSAKQLATRGFGELKPIIRERSREADAANRRVDFGVIEIEKIPQTIQPKDAGSSQN